MLTPKKIFKVPICGPSLVVESTCERRIPLTKAYDVPVACMSLRHAPLHIKRVTQFVWEEQTSAQSKVTIRVPRFSVLLPKAFVFR